MIEFLLIKYIIQNSLCPSSPDMAITLPSSSTNSTPAIVGGVVGGLAALTIISFSAYILFCRRKSKGMVVNRRVPIDDDMTLEGHPSMNEFNRLHNGQGETMAIGTLPDEPSPDPPPYTSQEGHVSLVAPPILPKPGNA